MMKDGIAAATPLWEEATIIPTRRTLITRLALACLAGPAALAAETPVVTLTPAQEKSLSEEYFNCDHEGEVGCLMAACKQKKLSQDARTVQYLYRDVQTDFPEMLTPKLRSCFLRAGGRFRID